MTASSFPWSIDPGVARDLAHLVGWDPSTGPVALAGAMADQVPAGTTAKLAAVAAGEVPPGADPESVARRILDDRATGSPTPAWSCWALSTVMAALLAHGGRPASVAALRRIDPGAPAVDLHSLVVTDDDGPVVCDPYFAAVLPDDGPERAGDLHRGVVAERVDEPDGRWTYQVRLGRWSSPLAYRTLAPVLDPDDVAALCVVSITHTGVPPGPCASLWCGDLATDAFVRHAGGAVVREWRSAPPDSVDATTSLTEHRSWADAAVDMGERTGIALL